ncbi:MAG: ribbon-helix-helix protein, CopG family [Acidipila sp.]|nr:ribbon-helix-helix protein, CopG family [Acidipila sp.]
MKKPSKKLSTLPPTRHLRLPAAIDKRIRELARRESRSMHNLMTAAVIEYVEKHS